MSYLCVICEESLSYKDSSVKETSDSRQINTTPCGHVFHTSCLNDWFATQKRKQSESYNYNNRLPGISNTTCPSCQRQVNPTQSTRIYPTEEDSITPIAGVKTKAELNQEISELKEKIRQLEANNESVEADLINSLQCMSIEKESVDLAYRQLQLQFAEKVKSSGNNSNAIADLAVGSLAASTASVLAEPDISISEATDSVENDDIVALVETKGGLKINDHVVWINGDNTEVGRVLWLGKLLDGSILAGIEFVNPIGSGTMIPVINGRKAFTCQPDYGRMVPVKELILYKDYHGCDTEPVVQPRPAGENPNNLQRYYSLPTNY